MSTSFPPPFDGVSTATSPTSSASTSIIIFVIIIASAVIVTVCIYLLLQFLPSRFHRSFRTAADDVVLRQNSSHRHVAPTQLLDSLPLFTFGSVSGNLTGGDCAVCLSKFEPHDRLRLLPLCCHAFHSDCIDGWIASNQTCPLCRSTVFPSDSDSLDKILPTQNRGDSFRVEIGSVSRRRGNEDGTVGRSYSIGGSFEYVVGDGDGYEVSVDSTAGIHRRGVSDYTDKESTAEGEALAAEVGGRSWLRDYVDRMASSSSRALSFRGSGRFLAGSSRRNDSVEDLEANRAGEEISELFRWLSGV